MGKHYVLTECQFNNQVIGVYSSKKLAIEAAKTRLLLNQVNPYETIVVTPTTNGDATYVSMSEGEEVFTIRSYKLDQI